jgi:outer membrane murein-binding lipoprotein Lpp
MKNKLLISSLLLISILISGCNNQTKQIDESSNTKNTEYSEETISKAADVAKIESSKVCYVNNKFMGIDQIPVEFENKTYYGCCEGCVIKLKTMRETRYALDPSTGKEVDKALAFIVLSPTGNNDVLYFESEQTYKNYIKL